VLILASDGLWEVVTQEEAVGLVADTVKDADMCAKRLATEAMTRGSRDNITVLVAFLQVRARLGASAPGACLRRARHACAAAASWAQPAGHGGAASTSAAPASATQRVLRACNRVHLAGTASTCACVHAGSGKSLQPAQTPLTPRPGAPLQPVATLESVFANGREKHAATATFYGSRGNSDADALATYAKGGCADEVMETY
jgi:hypothetical protein